MAQSLVEIHAILAATVHPALAMNDNQADALATALARVQEHYPGVKLMSDKHMAICGLILCAGRIYVPMGLAMMQPPKTEPPVSSAFNGAMQPGAANTGELPAPLAWGMPVEPDHKH